MADIAPGSDEDEARIARAGLVRQIDAAGAWAEDPAWRTAFTEIPRHLFVPYYYVGVGGGYRRLWGEDPDPAQHTRWLRGAYADTALATRVRDGELVSSSSQPSLMALMLTALRVQDQPPSRVLEIGAGSGYNAALLAHRLGDEQVTTIDLDPEITATAREHLAAVGRHPHVVTGDGARGWPARAPYDRIIATCTLATVPRAWLAQCRPGALVLTPFATGLLLLRVQDAEHAEGRFLDTSAFFVPLRGTSPPPEDTREPAGLPRRALRHDLFRFLLALTGHRLTPQEALALWHQEHHPERARYGVSVRGPEAWAWLDDPEGPYTWRL
ncbi:methyltransferase domain-containing protein [Streptomyces sp. NPDC058045]|uniref:methyltransferase domain-containing protein n=1 Tax=Streptomyces sp. NPDC058045 TaxID=3346311 RepID=UPI0036E61D47